MVELNIVGGHVAVDLVNTIDPRTPSREPANEHLPSPAALLVWAARVDLVTSAEAAQVAQSWRRTDSGSLALRTAVEVREATYDVLLAELGHINDAGAALILLRDRWADAISRSALRLGIDSRPNGDDRLHVGTDPNMLIPDRLANATVELLRSLDTRQLKTCPLDEGGCGWLFLDRSYNQSRRWCSMEDCGARAKARRLTTRRRADRASRSTTAPQGQPR